MKILPSKDIKKFFEQISDAENILIVSHSHPDGDALGSCVAMLSWLRSLGRRATAVLPDRHPDCLDFIIDGTLAPDLVFFDTDRERAAGAIAGSDLVIMLDMNRSDRAGDEIGKLLDASPAGKILIDHHPGPDRDSFEVCFSETEISSTSELLYWILKEMPDIPLPPDAATALMAGMTTDTNNFANSVFPTTLVMASELLSAGVDRDEIISRVFNSYRAERVRLMGRLLDRHLKFTGDGVAYMILTRRTAEIFGVQEGDTEGFVNIPLSIGKVRLSIFLRQEQDRFRVSIRSKKGVSANRLAALYFRGGGHEMASGGKLLIPEDVGNAREAALYIEASTHQFFSEDNEPE